MTFLGLHWTDVLLMAGYVFAVLFVRRVLVPRADGREEFFLAGRRLGRWLQFFLHFGNSVDPTNAPVMASSVYRSGVSGVWLQLTPMFATPFFWFLNVWYRRSRLTTIGDIFYDRFGSRFLASFYAITTLAIGFVVIGAGYIIIFKTLAPIMVKPVEAYTVTEHQSVNEYYEYTRLHDQRKAEALSDGVEARYTTLQAQFIRGKIAPYVSYLKAPVFYVISSALVGLFIMFGGLRASAGAAAVETVLVTLTSVVLIPFGLFRLGGFQGLHQLVPRQMFLVFGGTDFTEYTWFSITMLFLAGFIGNAAAAGAMNVSGAAADETGAQLGAVGALLAKRVITVFWCVCGIIAMGLFGPHLADPDQAWGLMTNQLLPHGLIGTMIIAILGGKLSALGVQAIYSSALVLKNIYEPLFPDKNERHYMIVARLSVPLVMFIGVMIALYLDRTVEALKFLIAANAIWGAPVLLMFTWRRLTETAIRLQVIICLGVIWIGPWFISSIPSLRQHPSLLVMSPAQDVLVEMGATPADVTKGLAAKVGEKITVTRRVDPYSVFFDQGVLPIDPVDKNSPREGLGRFNLEAYLLYLCGFDVVHFSKAGLMTARYGVDVVLPLILLFVVSLLTSPCEPQRAARFFARLKTPIAATREADALEVEKSYANPTRFDHTKLFPRSNWEFTKWSNTDTGGVIFISLAVVAILGGFKLLVTIGG